MRHMKSLKIIAISATTLLATLFTSCAKEESKDVAQDKIYAEYELYYDKNQNKTYASAVFKFSNVTGTNLQLTAPSEVTFNNDIIPFDGTFAYYRKEYAGLIQSGTFNFKDTDSKVYSNSVSLAKVIANPNFASTDTIKRSNGAYTYTFSGDSITANEIAGLTIAFNSNFQVFYQSTLGAKNFVLPLTQLNALSIGLNYCRLDRTFEKAAPDVTSAGGKIRGKYRSEDKNVYVK
jgi:hypothetical protein